MLAVFSFFNVLLYFSNAHLFFFDALLTAFRPLYWYLVTIGLGAVLLALRRRPHSPSMAPLRLIVWATVFTLMAATSFIFLSPADANALEVFYKSLEAMALLVTFALIFRDDRVARVSTYAVLLVVTFSVIVNYAEFLHLVGNGVRLSFVTGRAAGLYENPNISGQQLVFGMVLSVFVVPRRLRWLYCLFVASGVILTFSRGAILLWIIAVIGLAWRSVFVLPRKLSVSVLTLGAAILGVALAAGEWVGGFEAAGLERYLNSNTAARIGGSFLDQTDYSRETRMLVAQQGFEMFLEKPMFGWGIGATSDSSSAISPHNMYLRLGIEYGFFGMLMLATLMSILWNAGNERSGIFAVLYGVAGLFTHNNLEQPTVILALALAVANIEIVRLLPRQRNPEPSVNSVPLGNV